MKQDIKNRWINALLSGEYTQGTGYLHRISGGKSEFCCLGVLCDLAAREGVVAAVRGRAAWDDDDAVETVSYDGAPSILPSAVKEWAGLESENPVIPIEALREMLGGRDGVEEFLDDVTIPGGTWRLENGELGEATQIAIINDHVLPLADEGIRPDFTLMAEIIEKLL